MTELIPKPGDVREWLDLTRHPRAWLLAAVGAIVGLIWLWRDDPVAFAAAMAYAGAQPVVLALAMLAFGGLIAALAGATAWSLSERLHTAEFKVLQRQNTDLQSRVAELERQAESIGEGGLWHSQWVKAQQQVGKLERMDRATMAALPLALMHHGLNDDDKVAILDAIDKARYSVTDKQHTYTPRTNNEPQPGGLRPIDPTPPLPDGGRRVTDRL